MFSCIRGQSYSRYVQLHMLPVEGGVFKKAQFDHWDLVLDLFHFCFIWGFPFISYSYWEPLLDTLLCTWLNISHGFFRFTFFTPFYFMCSCFLHITLWMHKKKFFFNVKVHVVMLYPCVNTTCEQYASRGNELIIILRENHIWKIKPHENKWNVQNF